MSFARSHKVFNGKLVSHEEKGQSKMTKKESGCFVLIPKSSEI